MTSYNLVYKSYKCPCILTSLLSPYGRDDNGFALSIFVFTARTLGVLRKSRTESGNACLANILTRHFDRLVRQARVGIGFEDPKHPRLIAGGARREAVGGMSEAKVLKATPRAPRHKPE